MDNDKAQLQAIPGDGLLAQLDLPQVGRKFPAGYHEAYWFYGYDANTRVGYYFYLVADTADEVLRHEHTFLYLPDGSILAGYSSGIGTRAATAVGDRLEFQCELPFTRWHIRYAANMTPIPAHRRLEGPLDRHETVPVDIALTFDARTPAWNTEGDWGEPPPALRYHQLGHASGTVRWQDTLLQIGSRCFRSHSRRQREMAGWAGHTLANGLFPGDRAFGIFRMRGSASLPERGRGFIIDKGRLYDVDVLQYPQLQTPGDKPETFEIVLRGNFGIATIRGETLIESFLSQTPAGRRHGVDWNAAAGMVLADGFARYRWDDEETIGVIERSALPAALQRPQ